MRGSRREASDLRLIFHLSEFRAPADGIDIVVIPALNITDAAEHRRTQCSWLKLLIASTDEDTRVFLFHWAVNTRGSAKGNVWYQILDHARVLLDSLRQARPFDVQRRPLHFIVHSLGGLMLKQALYLAHYNYPAIRNALAGIIFLGTPHLTTVDDDRWDVWRSILKLCANDVPKNSLQGQDIQLLSNICENFNRLNIQIPILSVYETVPTKIKSQGPLAYFQTTEPMLVDRRLVTVNSDHEELFGTDHAHLDLGVVDYDTPLFKRLVQYLSQAPLASAEIVSGAFRRLELNLDDSDTQSRGYTTSTLNGSGDLTPSSTRSESMPQVKNVLLPCYSLEHNRNKNFFGQTNILKQMDEALSAQSRNADDAIKHGDAQDQGKDAPNLRAIVLCGMGGLGKSEIAIEYMHSRKNDYEAIFWVNSASVQKLDVSFREIAVKLGLQDEETSLNDDPEATRDIVKAWLASPVRTIGADAPRSQTSVRWLLVFDNADEPDMLENFWPLEGTGSIIVTSRDPLTKKGGFAQRASLHEINGIDLSPMIVDDAVKLLQNVSLREEAPENRDSCVKVVDLLGCLPLAITQMAYQIRVKHLSLSEFIEYYEQDTTNFHEAAPISSLTKQQSIASIWNVESLDPTSLALLQVLSVLDPDMIPESILLTGASKVLLQDYPKTRIAYFDARATLMKSSLVTRNVELGFLRIHRIVQDVVRQKMNDEHLRNVFNAAVTLVSTVWPFANVSALCNSDRLRKVQQLVPHVAAFRSIIENRTHSEPLNVTIAVTGLFNEIAWLHILQSWGTSLRDGANYSSFSAKVLLDSGDQGDKRIYTKLLSDSYRYSCICSNDMDGGDAMSFCEKWMQMLVERVEEYQDPTDIYSLAVSYSEYGLALMHHSKTDEALKSFERSCESLEEITPKGEPVYGFPYKHRARILTYNGKSDLAEAVLVPALEAREKILGKDDTFSIETSHLLLCMAILRHSQGRDNEALDYERRAYKTIKITAGERSVWTAQIQYHLARSLFKKSEYQEARTLLDQALTVVGDNPWLKPSAARAYWKLGRVLQAEGSHENGKEALEMLDRAMRLRHEIVPDDHRQEQELIDDDWDDIVQFNHR